MENVHHLAAVKELKGNELLDVTATWILTAVPFHGRSEALTPCNEK